jgi:hypothetical protein
MSDSYAVGLRLLEGFVELSLQMSLVGYLSGDITPKKQLVISYNYIVWFRLLRHTQCYCSNYQVESALNLVKMDFSD